MPGARRSSDQRLSLIVETGREIAAAGEELQSVIQLIADRAQAITGADGAMVNLIWIAIALLVLFWIVGMFRGRTA